MAPYVIMPQVTLKFEDISMLRESRSVIHHTRLSECDMMFAALGGWPLRCTKGWMDAWMDGCMDAWMDEHMNARMDGDHSKSMNTNDQGTFIHPSPHQRILPTMRPSIHAPIHPPNLTNAVYKIRIWRCYIFCMLEYLVMVISHTILGCDGSSVIWYYILLLYMISAALRLQHQAR